MEKRTRDSDSSECVADEKMPKYRRLTKGTKTTTKKTIDVPHCAQCARFLYKPHILTCCGAMVCGWCVNKKPVVCTSKCLAPAPLVMPVPALAEMYEIHFPDEWARSSEPRTIDEWRVKYTALDPTLQMSNDAETPEEKACVVKILNAITKDFMLDGRLYRVIPANSSPSPAADVDEAMYQHVSRYYLEGCGTMQYTEKPAHHVGSTGHLIEVEVFNRATSAIRFQFPDRCLRALHDESCTLHCDDDDDDDDDDDNETEPQRRPVSPMDTAPSSVATDTLPVVTSIPSQPVLPAIVLTPSVEKEAATTTPEARPMVPAVLLTPPSTPAPSRQVSWPLPPPVVEQPPLVVHDPSWTYDEEDALKRQVARYREHGLKVIPWHEIRLVVPELGRFSAEQTRAKFDQLQPLVIAPDWTPDEEKALIKRIKKYKRCGISSFPWENIRLDDLVLNRFTAKQIEDKYNELESIAPILPGNVVTWTPELTGELVKAVQEVRGEVGRIRWALVHESNAKLHSFTITQLQSRWTTVQKSLNL